MPEIILRTDRLELAKRIHEELDDTGEQAQRLVESLGDPDGWLNPDIDWDSEENQRILRQYLFDELSDDAHLDGTATPPGEHTAVVNLIAPDPAAWEESWETVGSGVRVAERVILTAKHVIRNGGAKGIGGDDPRTAHRFQQEIESVEFDVAALVFESLPAAYEIVPIASSDDIRWPARYRSVGFGWTQCTLDPALRKRTCVRPAATFKNHLDGITVQSLDCTGPDDVEYFQCKPGKELVAGAANRMAYRRDSGGGLFVCAGGEWKLVGIIGGQTSLKYPAARYTRIDAIRDEINEELADNGLPTF